MVVEGYLGLGVTKFVLLPVCYHHLGLPVWLFGPQGQYSTVGMCLLPSCTCGGPVLDATNAEGVSDVGNASDD